VNQPVTGVTIQSQDEKCSVGTDSDGNYGISRIATLIVYIGGSSFFRRWDIIWKKFFQTIVPYILIQNRNSHSMNQLNST